jgi:hypothetical protein
MIITSIVINIEPTEKDQDIGLAPKSIVLNGAHWKVPPDLFPRDIRFISAIEELVRNYNRGYK